MKDGFTLVEVIVALLLLEVGLLAVAGVALTAGRLVREAVEIERVVTEADRLLDSLAAAPGPGAGRWTLPFGDLAWSVDARGVARLRFPAAGGDPRLEVETVLPAGAP